MRQLRVKLSVAYLAVAMGPFSLARPDEPPLPPPRPPDLAPAPTAKPAAEQSAPPYIASSACLSKLIADGAHAEVAAVPALSAEGCGIASPARLSAITLASGDVVSLADRPALDCAFALVLADYVRLIVAPLGEAMLHAKVAAIETGPGYECRTEDHIGGAKISAHAKGLAVDFVAIAFADKRRVLVERQRARMKRPTSELCGRPLAGGSRPFSGPGRTRSTPTICTWTSKPTDRAATIASANNTSPRRGRLTKRGPPSRRRKPARRSAVARYVHPNRAMGLWVLIGDSWCSLLSTSWRSGLPLPVPIPAPSFPRNFLKKIFTEKPNHAM